MSLFEQIGKRITDASQSVAKQTKNLTSAAQLNNAISEYEKRISQILFELGKLYYEKYKDDMHAEFRESIEQINALYTQIQQDREKIKIIKGIIKCVNCKSDIPIDAVFCNVCGTRAHRDASIDNGTMERCSVCSSIVSDENSFCSDCGSKVER